MFPMPPRLVRTTAIAKSISTLAAPADRVQEGRFGACLMAEPDEAAVLLVCTEWGLISLPYQVPEEADALGVPLVGRLEIA